MALLSCGPGINGFGDRSDKVAVVSLNNKLSTLHHVPEMTNGLMYC